MSIQLQQLAGRAAAGDAVARAGLLAASMPVARALARRLVDDPDAVDDVVQESLLDVYSSIGTLRQPAAYHAWLALVVRKHADRYRRRLRPTALLDLVLDRTAGDSADPALAAERDDRVAQVRRALHQTRDADRILLGLRYYAEWTDAELAAFLGISAGAVRKRLHDARRRMRLILAASRTSPQEMVMAEFGQIVDPTTASPLPAVPPLNQSRDPAAILPTGIKVLDALAPWPLGGTVDLLGPVGTGHLVLLGEIVHNLLATGPAALIGVAAGAEPELARLLEPEARPTVTMIVQGPAESALDYAARSAAGLAADGSRVILVVDRIVADTLGQELFADRVGVSASGGSVTGVRFAPDTVTRWPTAGAVAVTSLEELAAGYLPAIDPLESRSTVYLGTAQRDVVARGRRAIVTGNSVRSYLTQHFWMAEEFTGVPGEAFTRQQALTGLAAALEG